MISKYILTFGVFFLFSIKGIAQINSDSSYYEDKFKRLQFQIDSLNGVSIKGNVFELIKQQTLIDSLNSKVNKSENELKVVRYNLYKMHQQFQVANVIAGVGIGLAFVGAIMSIEADEVIGLLTTSSGVILGGIVAPLIKLDGYKYLRAAGKKYRVVKKN